MEFESNVENQEGIGIDDVFQAPESAPQGGDGPSLAEVLGQDTAQQAPPEQGAEQTKVQTEPGWMKARIEKAVQKELARVQQEAENRIRAEYAPFREMLLQQEADKLVSSGKITDPALALQFVKMQKGESIDAPAAKPAKQDPEPEQTQTPAPDPMTEKYGKMLLSQALYIKEQGGPDVMAAYENDPEIQAKVLAMEWDFEDVANHLVSIGAKRKMPPATRTANVGGPKHFSIENMGRDDLNKLDEQLSKGVRVDLRK